jgi:hypothetical protein
MSTIKNLIATVLISSAALASFAQAPAASTDAGKITPAAPAASAPIATVKHTARKVAEPQVKDVAATTPGEAASKPSNKPKKTHKSAPTDAKL